MSTPAQREWNRRWNWGSPRIQPARETEPAGCPKTGRTDPLSSAQTLHPSYPGRILKKKGIHMYYGLWSRGCKKQKISLSLLFIQNSSKLWWKMFRFFPTKRAADNSDPDSSDSYLPAVLIKISQKQLSGPCHFGTDPDPHLWLTDLEPGPDLDPALFVIDLQDTNKNSFLFKNFLLFTFRRYIYKSFFKDKTHKGTKQYREIKVFLTTVFFCLMMEGSKSGRPKNLGNLQIRIWNTAPVRGIIKNQTWPSCWAIWMERGRRRRRG